MDDATSTGGISWKGDLQVWNLITASIKSLEITWVGF